MEFKELVEIIKQAGICGAGGAGFPTYAKLDQRADTVILNCAECEPLLKLHRQVMEKYAHEIMSTLQMMVETLGAQRAIIAIKGSYEAAVAAIRAELESFSRVEIGILPETYPAGDEVVTIYETTGRVVPPGSLPINIGVCVFNVETVLNIYHAWKEQKPVTVKYITIAGEVKNPTTFKAPLGITYGELIQMAGGPTVAEYALIAGGPMTGMICQPFDPVTKTSNAVLVLPRNHEMITRRLAKVEIDMKRAMAACCQCRMCTDLCPRHLLGHPIEPHAFMRAASSGKAPDIKPLINTMFCSQCGLCEYYSCFQHLSPRTLIGEYKARLRKSGVPVPHDIPAKPVFADRSLRMVSKERLTVRLNLSQYDVPAPLVDETVQTDKVKILLAEHIGAPDSAIVKVGDTVTVGQEIGAKDEAKLGVPVHASINGVVTEVTDRYVAIRAKG